MELLSGHEKIITKSGISLNAGTLNWGFTVVYYGRLQPESNVSIVSVLVPLLFPVYNVWFYTLPHWSNLICSILVHITPSQG
jgi:hypothetical protein